VTLEKIAKDVTSVLATIPGAIDIKISRKPLPFEFDVVFDNARLALYNVTVPQVVTFLRNTID
jgi:Cu/Ag efflux pump CusA